MLGRRVAALVLLIACRDTSGPQSQSVAKVVVTPSDTTIVAGSTFQLSAAAVDASGNVLQGRNITWRSSTTPVFVAEGDPLLSHIAITGRLAGTATITASSEGATGTATITVVPGPPAGLTVAPWSAEIVMGETSQFSARITDVAGNVLSSSSPTWSSSDTTVLVVDGATGLAHGVGSGNATVFAKLNDKVSAQAGVVVLGVLGGVTTTDLGAASFGSSSATSINNLGNVVGSLGSGSDTHAFFWTATSGMTDLGPNLTASAINDGNQVALTQVNVPSGGHAVRWSQSAGMQDLGVLKGGQISAAFGINNAGDVVGQSDAGGSNMPHAFLWTDRDGMRDLNVLSGDVGSFANSINDLGQVVGESFSNGNGYCDYYYDYCSQRGFLWTAAQGLTDISRGSTNNNALAINDSGQVVGVSNYGAFLLKGSAFQQLTTSLVGATSSAFAINSSGLVVGERVSPGENVSIPHPFIWSVQAGTVLLSAAQGGARGINDHGQVVGWIIDPKSQLTHAVLWTLPATLAASRRK
ncbi:MAG TPA: hypothetical protein VJN70_14790 [Gemmatimonadaceae bacterium]|nr:hypothetical protein [Gemmatimonadaceae bacterium]